LAWELRNKILLARRLLPGKDLALHLPSLLLEAKSVTLPRELRALSFMVECRVLDGKKILFHNIYDLCRHGEMNYEINQQET